MNFRKNVFALFLLVAFAAPIFASSNFAPKEEPAKTVTKEIKTILEKIPLDFEKLNEQTIRVKFMVNESGELIVISTDKSTLDKTLKHALNYQKVDATDLTPYSPYVVPIKFETS